jgi:hypothetical protein
MPDSLSQGFSQPVVGELDHVRAQEQALLSTSLLCSANAQIVEGLAVVLRGNVGPLSITQASLAEAAARTNAECVKRASFNVFVRLGGGGFLLYASYYPAGSLCERPFAQMLKTIRCLGVEKSGEHSEREDCGRILRGGMAHIAGSHIVGQPRRLVHFPRSIAPWLGHRFAGLEHAECADLCARGRT